MNRRDFIKASATIGAVTLLPQRGGADDGASKEVGLRQVEVYSHGAWHTTPWSELKKDMIFRLRGPDGFLMGADAEDQVCVASDAAVPGPAPMYWSVLAEAFTHVTGQHPLAKRVQVWKDGHLIGHGVVLDMSNETVTVMSKNDDGTFLSDNKVLTFDHVSLRPA